LIDGRRSILLFLTKEKSANNAIRTNTKKDYRKIYTFVGIFWVGSWSWYIPTSGNRKGNKLIKFILVEAIDTTNFNQLSSFPHTRKTYNLSAISKELNNLGNQPVSKSFVLVEQRERSDKIREYALLRANGMCELCRKEGPFVNIDEIIFLEVHHIYRLADDGPDIPENVAAICPNCHREAHFGKNKEKIREKLASIIHDKEILIHASNS